jgi:hypothetical protein
MICVSRVHGAVRHTDAGFAAATARGGRIAFLTRSVRYARRCSMWNGGRLIAYGSDDPHTKGILNIHALISRV